MSYKLTHEGYVIKDGNTKVPTATSADFPNRNPDYLAYLAWLEAGNTPEPADPLPVVVPQTVTMRQARLALLGAGLLATVDSAINALPGPQKEAARIEWEYSQEVQRHNGFVSVLAPSLGLSAEQVDQLFVAAAKL